LEQKQLYEQHSLHASLQVLGHAGL